jgi:hypothetical protein
MRARRYRLSVKGLAMTAGTASSPQEPASQPFLIALVIDKSGSMEPLVEQTVAGFNEFLADQRANAPEALMHVTLFDDVAPVIRAI